MSIDLVKDRLASYQCTNPLLEEQALKEITQELILMGLARTDFFSKAEFHGGTALRILYQLPRFSEDLDFALLSPNKQFSFLPYTKHLSEELSAFGYRFEIKDRSKADNAVKKAFLKDDSIGQLLVLERTGLAKKILIKLEIDSNPPTGATTEFKPLTFPVPFAILAKDLPSSFAGKLHAILCRGYVKGRDWYDFIWYVAHKTPINYVFLKNGFMQNGPYENQDLPYDKTWLINELTQKIDILDWKKAVFDVSRFLDASQLESLKLWGKDFFHDCTKKLANYL